MPVISSLWCWSVLVVCMSRGVFTRSRESGRVVHLVNNNVPSFLYFNTAPGDTRQGEIRNNVVNFHEKTFHIKIYPFKPLAIVERRAAVVFSGRVEGTLSFTQSQPPIGKVEIEGVIRNLTPGLHGIHIHELGDIRAGCGAVGAHYNPYDRSHGGPSDLVRHIGDLGNIEADNQGIAYVNITDTTITLLGPRSVMARAIVVKEASDNFGRGDHVDRLNTGNSGAPVGCGVIGYA
ncbi:unnamed protein product [Meganyctiphanes norvegica]|uniref:superoxide dismutase n=1 Tax=Meganyctiphanes norvegica TaxID=48144 RepID=A0AAV2RGS8_MEGNR